VRSAVSRWLPPLSIALRVRATATLTLSSAHLLAGTLHRRERRAHGVGTENCRPRGDGRAGRHAGSRWPNAPGVAALYSAGARHHKGLRSRAACPVGFLLGASGWTAPRRKGQCTPSLACVMLGRAQQERSRARPWRGQWGAATHLHRRPPLTVRRTGNKREFPGISGKD